MHIDSYTFYFLMLFMNIHVGLKHISVLTTCTYMFRQVCIIEPLFFNTASGMHRRPFEGRHLVCYVANFLGVNS